MVSEEKISGFYVCPKLPSPTRVVGITAKKTGDGAAVSLSLPLLSGPPLSTEPDYEPNVGASHVTEVSVRTRIDGLALPPSGTALGGVTEHGAPDIASTRYCLPARFSSNCRAVHTAAVRGSEPRRGQSRINM